MDRCVWLLLGSMAAGACQAGDFNLFPLSREGTLLATNAPTNGVVTFAKALTPDGPWAPDRQVFSTSASARVASSLDGGAGFYRARALDLSGPGSWEFALSDILDLESFVNELTLLVTTIQQTTYDHLSPGTQELLWFYSGGADADLRQALVLDLNAWIQSTALYDPFTFDGVGLSALTQSLLDLDASRPLQGSALLHLNRLLLEDAFPSCLRKKRDTGFPNFTRAYGVLSTLAGAGGTTASPYNKWLPEFEGGFATNALLSRPHIAMADRAGNIYIADKEAHAIRKVTVDGRIQTVAGTSSQGRGTTDPAPATTVALSNPNGLWVKPDGTLFILDMDNGLIRKVDTNGLCTLMVDNGAAISRGRGLWVSPDESVVLFAGGSELRRWDTTNGLGVFVSGFYRLGNFAIDPQGRLAVADPLANVVYWIAPDGSRTVLAGNGTISGGGDGYLATETGLGQVRGIWFLPNGGCFLGTDNGVGDGCNKVWYVDTDGYIHLFLNGDWSAHTGDGDWFYNPGVYKVSAIRQITLDYEGNLIITEHDAGYVRKVRFLPQTF